MKSKRIRFGEIEIGIDFEWAGRMMKKISELRATSLVPRQEFLFKKSDLVSVQVPEEDEDEDFYPMYGLSGSGSAAPDPSFPLTQDVLDDMYDTSILDDDDP